MRTSGLFSRRRRGVVGAAAAAAVLAATSWSSASSAETTPFTLVVSTSATRGGAVPLAGHTANGDIFVFVTADAGATRVDFWLDQPPTGTPRRSETNPPYDFNGGTVSTATAFRTTTISDGSHMISAAIVLTDGSVSTRSATFTVANTTPSPSTSPSPSPTTSPSSSTPAPSPSTGPGAYTLWTSTSPDRTAPVPLTGATVSANSYIFLTPDAGATQVRFWLDNPSMSGTPRQTEGSAPWDFAGTISTSGAAKPFDTRTVADGVHIISASVSLAAGGTTTAAASFTVANGTSTSPTPSPTPTVTPTASPTPTPSPSPVPPGAPSQVHLSWTQSPSTTLTVVWKTATTSAPSTAEFRAVGTGSWLQAVGSRKTSGTSGTLHVATMTGLSPATAYEYRVPGDGGAWSPAYVARTAPGAGSDFDVVLFADTGIEGRLDGLTSGTTQVLDVMAQLRPAAYLAAGDFAYANTDTRFATVDAAIDAWFDQMQRVATVAPMMPAYGNHEVLLGEPITSWLARFATPTGHEASRNYTFDIGDVHFISIFAVHNTAALKDAQFTWLKGKLAAARTAGKRIVPFMHVSSFADGANHPSNLALRAQLGPVFEQYGVKLVLMAHDQAYERSYPLVDVPTTLRRTSTNLRCYTMSDGVTWVTASPGGKLSNKNGGFSQFRTTPQPAWTAFRENTRHHIARVTFKANGSIRFDSLGIAGDGSPVVIDDSFEYTSPTGSCSLTN